METINREGIIDKRRFRTYLSIGFLVANGMPGSVYYRAYHLFFHIIRGNIPKTWAKLVE